MDNCQIPVASIDNCQIPVASIDNFQMSVASMVNCQMPVASTNNCLFFLYPLTAVTCLKQLRMLSLFFYVTRIPLAIVVAVPIYLSTRSVSLMPPTAPDLVVTSCH
jgi:hypothetical protein